ncbi:MAG TPA: GNAT family N-acetyltransferase [Chloroflexota bacterium]|nr:GNAT family N-acetyltransferase [Chloroflexota bacterium]HUM68496.1 GNAT family N-acetyltransferase [Chloroflexota bacterium]
MMYKGAMRHEFTLSLPVTIRPARMDDIPQLEWFGMITPFREILAKDFAASQTGELVYLVAEVNDFPVGQVEADLIRFRDTGVGYIMALRVLPPFQNLGIGSGLMTAVEQAICHQRLFVSQLNVGKTNQVAQRLYKKLGYQIVGEETTPWSYTTPQGEVKTIEEPELVMQKSLKEAGA